MNTKVAEMPLGAAAVEGGVLFKVWAPHAESVSVVGDWNGWDAAADPMEPSEGGAWGCFSEKASPGSQYKFALRSGEATLERIDPRAREVTNSVGKGVVYADDFDWEGDDYCLPPHNELAIYELHPRNFAIEVDGDGSVFDQVIRKLDYLSNLGINAIELMPIAEFAGDISWGYNPAHILQWKVVTGGLMP